MAHLEPNIECFPGSNPEFVSIFGHNAALGDFLKSRGGTIVFVLGVPGVEDQTRIHFFKFAKHVLDNRYCFNVARCPVVLKPGRSRCHDRFVLPWNIVEEMGSGGRRGLFLKEQASSGGLDTFRCGSRCLRRANWSR